MKDQCNIWLAVLFAVVIFTGAPELMAQKNGNEPATTTTDEATDKTDNGHTGDAAKKKNESGDKQSAETEDGEGETEEKDGDADGAGEEEASESLGFQRSGRMEFDERLVKGQAAKSGAVYLFQRTPRRLPGLVPYRRSYRTRIVEPVLGKRELKPPRYSTQKTDETETGTKEAPSSDEEVAETSVEETKGDEENSGVKKKNRGKARQKAAWKKKYGAKREKKTGGNQ
jgi:hypothetical protein